MKKYSLEDLSILESGKFKRKIVNIKHKKRIELQVFLIRLTGLLKNHSLFCTMIKKIERSRILLIAEGHDQRITIFKKLVNMCLEHLTGEELEKIKQILGEYFLVQKKNSGEQ